ncbi:MAG: response regulator transcription factor [Lachnospiraceae bacterium]|nr:response regulator transcription factor [Lachnospiraceae bacterium]
METEKILVVDDDRDIVATLRIHLERENYTVFSAHDGYEALDILEKEEIHLILLDVMMPHLDGFSALMKIRETRNIPVIIMSAKTEDTDKILGLTIGADDYICKPFSAKEVLARVKSQLRRYMKLGGIHTPTADVIQIGRLCFNYTEHTLTIDGEPVRLTSTETRILELLMRHAGRIFSAEEIYREVWKEPIAYNGEKTVMVHIRRIREKIEINPGEPEYLKVVWGIGYKFEKK